MDLAAKAASSVSGRVLLSAREHFQNRGEDAAAGLPRVFANRKGTGVGDAGDAQRDRPGVSFFVYGAALAEARTPRSIANPYPH